MISKQEVKHIAKLARLALKEKEVKKFQKELSLILDYVEKLKEVDVSQIQAIFHSVREASFERGMRKDESGKQDLETAKKLIKMVPEKKDNYIKVKSIF